MMNPNNLILKTATSFITFILLGFALYLLFAGHNSPGGGFVGGLVTAVALLLMYMAYGKRKLDNIIRINFIYFIPIGLIVAIGTGLGALIFNKPFLTHTFTMVHLPLIGSIDLATAMFFDIGVYLTVLGTMMTIILNVSMDQQQ